jgi:hypothetical protein
VLLLTEPDASVQYVACSPLKSTSKPLARSSPRLLVKFPVSQSKQAISHQLSAFATAHQTQTGRSRFLCPFE